MNIVKKYSIYHDTGLEAIKKVYHAEKGAEGHLQHETWELIRGEELVHYRAGNVLQKWFKNRFSV